VDQQPGRSPPRRPSDRASGTVRWRRVRRPIRVPLRRLLVSGPFSAPGRAPRMPPRERPALPQEMIFHACTRALTGHSVPLSALVRSDTPGQACGPNGGAELLVCVFRAIPSLRDPSDGATRALRRTWTPCDARPLLQELKLQTAADVGACAIRRMRGCLRGLATRVSHVRGRALGSRAGRGRSCLATRVLPRHEHMRVGALPRLVPERRAEGGRGSWKPGCESGRRRGYLNAPLVQ